MSEATGDSAYGRFTARVQHGWDVFQGWRERRWFRWATYGVFAALISYLAIWAVFARDLPSAESLLSYEPPLPTNVRAIDGAPIHSYARERRVQLSFEEYPQPLIDAFLAAEDRTFFTHGGIDLPGIFTAVITNFTSSGRPVGASTITQQVAKNLLLSNELSYVRKIREIILARRIEGVLTKQQIMELYLNQIALGRNSFGVQAAARAYFDKDVEALALHEAAYLAILPKAPSTYSRAANAGLATQRRNFVLSEMARNEFITPDAMRAAQAQPLGLIANMGGGSRQVGGYFVEEVRRELIERFGESSDGGENPHSVYDGGLWVRTSMHPAYQTYTEDALRQGLLRYSRGQGWSGPVEQADISGGWRAALANKGVGIRYEDWRTGIVIDKSASEAEIGFVNGDTGQLPAALGQMPRRGGGSAFASLKPGDIIVVAPSGTGWALRNVPEISGGMVVQSPHTGRVLAMQGGFDSRLQSYNRATQAERQPGSTFKPVAYAAALDNGMTPASIIVDGAFCVWQGAALGNKCFRNFSGGNAGPQTMRWGLEQSRNLMTVRAASQTGMDKIVRTAARLGVNLPGKPYEPYLSVALGAGETTVMRLTNAYSIMANNGRSLTPTLIDYVQDRQGKVIHRADTRPCEGCNAPDWNGKAMPRPPRRTKLALDPRGGAPASRPSCGPMWGGGGSSAGPPSRCATSTARSSARPAPPPAPTTCGSSAARPMSSPASTWATISRARWAAMRRAAASPRRSSRISRARRSRTCR